MTAPRLGWASAALGAAALSLLLSAPPAEAHALVGRQDLPIPTWLFAWAASVVLIGSFVALSLAWRRPRFEGDRWRALPERLSRVVLSPVSEGLAAAIGLALAAAVVWSGLAGTPDPARNFAVTFVFVTSWLGLTVLSVLFGDVFRAFNPWRAIGRLAGAGMRALTGRENPHLAYPRWLGRWPAVAGIVAFLWLELVYGAGGGQAGGLDPRVVAEATLVYSALTWLGMAVFGVETWSERGEAFSVYFGMFARLAPLEVREGRLGLRQPLVGATQWAQVPGSAALVLAAIGGTSFDGAQEGALTGPIRSVFNWLVDQGAGLTVAFRLTDTLFMALVLLGAAALFTLGVLGMRTVRASFSAPRSLSASRLRSAFAHTLIPIALAYLVAHYFSLFARSPRRSATTWRRLPKGTASVPAPSSPRTPSSASSSSASSTSGRTIRRGRVRASSSGARCAERRPSAGSMSGGSRSTTRPLGPWSPARRPA